MALEGIKAGDKFAVRIGYSTPRYEVFTAERVTKTWVIVSECRRYRISDGRVVGLDSRYMTPELAMPITDEIADEVDACRLRYWLRDLNRHSLTVQQLRKIEEIVKG